MTRWPVGFAVAVGLTACRSSVPLPVVASVEPLTVTVISRAGGTVEEVFAKPGDRVAVGAPLVRLRPATLARRDELDRLLAAAKATASLPAALRNMLVDSHPDVERAEREYVEALRARDAGGPSERLTHAAAERVAVRNRISRQVGSGGAGVVPFLEARRRELDALGDGLVRSEHGGSVDLLDLRPGDRVPPGSPVALIVTGEAYSAEFEVPPGVAPPAAGAQGAAHLDGRRLQWTVESVHRRLIPPGLREDRSVSHRVAVRARIDAAGTIVVPGARAEFRWAGM